MLVPSSQLRPAPTVAEEGRGNSPAGCNAHTSQRRRRLQAASPCRQRGPAGGDGAWIVRILGPVMCSPRHEARGPILAGRDPRTPNSRVSTTAAGCAKVLVVRCGGMYRAAVVCSCCFPNNCRLCLLQFRELEGVILQQRSKHASKHSWRRECECRTGHSPLFLGHPPPPHALPTCAQDRHACRCTPAAPPLGAAAARRPGSWPWRCAQGSGSNNNIPRWAAHCRSGCRCLWLQLCWRFWRCLPPTATSTAQALSRCAPRAPRAAGRRSPS